MSQRILGRDGRALLAELAWSNVLLAFDFDGTLAPIVRDPERAVIPRRTRSLLARATRVYPCIVIAGRARRDLLERVRGLGFAQVIGNHGLEAGTRPDAVRSEVEGWRRRLQRALGRLPGVVIEDKQHTLSVHYRRSRHKRDARAAILDAVGRLDRVRVIGGKCVVNLVPLRAPHKGIAVERARAQLGCDTVLYVGDDESDEDVFALDQPGRFVGVRIGRSRLSAARYDLGARHEVDELVRELVRLREERGRRAS